VVIEGCFLSPLCNLVERVLWGSFCVVLCVLRLCMG